MADAGEDEMKMKIGAARFCLGDGEEDEEEEEEEEEETKNHAALPCRLQDTNVDCVPRQMSIMCQ